MGRGLEGGEPEETAALEIYWRGMRPTFATSSHPCTRLAGPTEQWVLPEQTIGTPDPSLPGSPLRNVTSGNIPSHRALGSQAC